MIRASSNIQGRATFRREQETFPSSQGERATRYPVLPCRPDTGTRPSDGTIFDVGLGFSIIDLESLRDPNRFVTRYLAMPTKQPLVLLFAGPSGHDKTELARNLGQLLSLDFHSVDCTNFKFKSDLFGPFSHTKDGRRAPQPTTTLQVIMASDASSSWTSLKRPRITSAERCSCRFRVVSDM